MLDKNDIEVIKELLKGALQTELQPIKDDIKALKADTQSLKTDTQALKADAQSLKTETQALKADTQSLKTDTQALKAGQDRHSLLLETMDKKLNTVIEGQQSQAEQIDRHFTRLNVNIKDDSSLIKSALKNVSSDVNDIKETTDRLDEENKKLGVVTGQNCVEIEYLKKLK
ncbi:hypothetical protein [Clostridium tyrobutyricum]|uniref:hypothetical protein n=1 Tax=Clostridium tyrobutyricum TaxID=1519 RepID=UPI0030CCC574